MMKCFFTKYIIVVLTIFLFTACENQSELKIDDKNLDALLKKYPDSIPLLIKHAKIAMDSTDFDTALADATKAYRLDSNRMETQEVMAKVLNNKPSRNLNDINTAQKLYHKVLKKKPKDTEVLVQLAATYSYQKDFEKSFKYLDDALRVNPKYRDAYFKKGTNFLELNQIDLAKSSYETAIQQDPSWWEAYIILGNLYELEENPVALEYYKTARDLQPDLVETNYQLAYAYQQFGLLEEAQVMYRKMYELDEQNAMPDFQIGYIKQFYANQPDSAMYYYDKATQIDPKFVEAWHNIGLLYEDKKDNMTALKYYSKALKYDPKFQKSRDAAERLK